MNTIITKSTTPILGDTSRLESAWRGIVAEVSAFASAIFFPRRIMADVERIAALHREAWKLDATDPAKAAELRQRAARISL